MVAGGETSGCDANKIRALKERQKLSFRASSGIDDLACSRRCTSGYLLNAARAAIMSLQTAS